MDIACNVQERYNPNLAVGVVEASEPCLPDTPGCATSKVGAAHQLKRTAKQAMDNPTILLVEDNRDDEDLTLCALQQNGITNPIVIARDGVEALDYLFGNSTCVAFTPQLVLMDLNLPRINGLEVLEKIRNHERTQFLPVVILTTSKEEKDIYASYRLHASSYIHKPVDFTQFVKIIGHIVFYWLSLNEPPPSAGE